MTTVRRCPRCETELSDDCPQGLCPQCLLLEGLTDDGATERAGEETADGAGARRDLPSPEDLAASFPQLEVLGLHGRGGMGAVYKARQPGLDRLVALKILPPVVGSRPGFEERFTREARALARLGHPNIVAVHDFGRANGLYYFIMEFVDGANLRQLLAGHQLSSGQALAIVPQICDALQYAHDEGIVHRDIKPENILIDRKGRVKIADFGLAKLLGGARTDYTLTAAQQVMGTPHYMAPEQLQSASEVDHRADIYSLGVVFYEMLTGELPLGRFPPPSQKASVDVRLDEVVLRTLEREPQRRYQHVSEVKTDLQGVGEPAAAIPMALPYRPPVADPAILRRIRRPALGLIVAGLLYMLAPMGIGLIWNRLGPPPDNDWKGWWLGIYPHLSVAPITGAIMFLAGLKMRRLESLRWAKVGSLLALIPWFPDGLIGLPAAIWALIILRKPETRSAFATAQSRLTTVGRVVWRTRIRRVVMIAIILLASASTCLTLMKPIVLAPRPWPIGWVGGHADSWVPFVTAADGQPILSDTLIRDLGLSKADTSEANRVFQAYYREFISLQRQHTKWSKEPNGHVLVTIQPFPQEADALTERMWAELGGIIDTTKIPRFGTGQSRSYSLFGPEGKATVTAEMWKQGKTYQFDEKLKWLDDKLGWGTSGRRSWGTDAKQVFPEEYRSYWYRVYWND